MFYKSTILEMTEMFDDFTFETLMEVHMINCITKPKKKDYTTKTAYTERLINIISKTLKISKEKAEEYLNLTLEIRNYELVKSFEIPEAFQSLKEHLERKFYNV